MLKFYEAYYEERGDYRRLLTTLTVQQSNQSELDEKVAIGVRMARIAQEHLGSHEKAIDIYRSILKLDPEHSEARTALRPLRQHQKWNALLEHLKEELSRASGDDDVRQVELLTDILGVYRDQLRLPAMVVATFQQILTIDPDHDEANRFLEETFRKSGRWNDLISLLTRRSEYAFETGAFDFFAKLSREIASLWIEKFSNYGQAAHHLVGVLDVHPDDRESVELLIEVAEQRHDWQTLFDALSKKVELEVAELKVEPLIGWQRLRSSVGLG